MGQCPTPQNLNPQPLRDLGDVLVGSVDAGGIAVPAWGGWRAERGLAVPVWSGWRMGGSSSTSVRSLDMEVGTSVPARGLWKPGEYSSISRVAGGPEGTALSARGGWRMGEV